MLPLLSLRPGGLSCCGAVPCGACRRVHQRFILNCPPPAVPVPPPLPLLQDGQEVLDKIMGYKLAPLGEAFKKLEGM